MCSRTLHKATFGLEKNGFDVWAATLEDAWSETRDFYLVYLDGTLDVISDYDAAKLDQLPDMDIGGGPGSCGDFANESSFRWLREDLTPREDRDPCWDSPVTYVPGSLFELIDTYGITDSSMTSADFPLVEPTIELALCQGLYIAAGPVQICHYCFFWTDPITPCIDYCQVSTGCFTNICMPTEVSAEWVRRELENNQTGYGW